MKESIKNILKRLNIYHPLQSRFRNLILSAKKRKYRRLYRTCEGSGFTCNICGATYKAFVPDHPSQENKQALVANNVIAGYGENVFCPNCLSSSRDRLVVAYIEKEIHLDGIRVLHIAPEKYVYDYLKKFCDVTTADLNPGFYRTIDPRVQAQDATRFKYRDKTFDLVVANHVMEHIRNDRAAMKEILRVLKPGGAAILQVPYSEALTKTEESPELSDPVLQSKLYGQKDHVRIYSLNDYVQRLKDAGFNATAIDPPNDFLQYAVQPREKILKIFRPVNS